MRLENAVPSLADLERLYLPQFTRARERRAVMAMIKLVHENCQISPFDATLTLPGNQRTMSTLGQFLRFFACGENMGEMPPDAPMFLRFLKSHGFPPSLLCLVKL